MLRDVQVILDPPPNGAFTFEDTVTGRVSFESNRDEVLAWCNVFFHCWVSTHIVKSTGNYQTSQVNSVNYKDKEVVFATSKKIYIGNGETLQKKVRYEWPFQFDFRTEMEDAASLPSSGKFGNGGVEYKVIAIPFTQQQAMYGDNTIKAMMDPNDQLFQKNSPISMTGIFMFGAKHLGGAAEQELQFVKIRPQGPVNGYLIGPFQSPHEIAVSHLPQLQQYMDVAPERHRLFPRSSHVPFEVHLQLPRNIIEAAYFPLLLNVNSRMRGWTENPPSATLVALKVHLVSRTIERASVHSQESDRQLLILDAKGLNIPLGESAVDLGQAFPIRFAGDGIVPSFDTRLMARKYDLLVEATVEIAGKQFHAKFLDIKNIELLSQHQAIGRPHAPPDAIPSAPREKLVYQLKHSYIGRITQVSNGVIKEASVMEAALAVSRALTKFEIPHEFPEGSLVKILPYKFDRRRTNTSNFDKMTDQDKIVKTFEESSLEFNPPEGWDQVDRPVIRLGYFDTVCGENLTFAIPTMSMRDDNWQKDWGKKTRNPADAVKLDAISLFNYRLSCGITHEKLSEAELGDFAGLYLMFSKDLHNHRKHIDVNAARIAAERYPQILSVLLDIGVDMEKGKGKEPERMPPPNLDKGKAVELGYEEDLVKGMKKHSFFHRKH